MLLLPLLCFWLDAHGIARTGTNLFYGPMKEEYPDTVVILNEYGGLPDEPDEGIGEGHIIRLESPRVNIQCRGPKDDYVTPRDLAEDIRASLASISNTVIEGTRVLSAFALQPPFPLGADKNRRQRFAFNVEVIKELSS